MNDLVKALVLGVVEGLTEFLPISSTGHLILFNQWFHFDSHTTPIFDVAIQLGAILAVVVLFRQYFFSLLKPGPLQRKRISLLAVVTLPGLFFGGLLHQTIKTHLFTPPTVAAAFIFGGILMIVIERRYKNRHALTDLDQITLKQAIWIGLWQCFALWPGMSRSASTIMGGLTSGLSYGLAAEFSFLAAVPIILAATVADVGKALPYMDSSQFMLIGVGLTTSFFVAILSIEFMLKMLKKIHFLPFAIYRFIIGGLIFALL